MRYELLLTKKARKFIQAQPKNQQIRLLDAINKLPSLGDIKPLTGKKDTFRLRVGDYRIIYETHNERLLITVVNIGNRGQIYKNF